MADVEKRRAYLNQIQKILPPSPQWQAWLERSGELPPDFETLPASYYPPDPLAGISGEAEWLVRREEIKQRLVYWITGAIPPRPDKLRVETISEENGAGIRIQTVRLHFGPRPQANLWVQLMIPAGEGPFPVFMTQHNHRDWAMIAARRGYIGCIYAGADTMDDTDTFIAAYPDYDWSRITRRAWAAMRCVDYLETVPEADQRKIAITGHSRNGKLSLIAAGLDQRFALVISSSSGAGGVLTARHFAEQHAGEGIEMITRRFPDWFHPRWRFFVGREHRLPVDLHDLVALAAPRPCLISTAMNDEVESVWASERTYKLVKPVYRFLEAEDNLRILWRPGAHETAAEVIERYVDWCDLHFGRGDFDFPERLYYPHDWEDWQQRSQMSVNVLPKRYAEAPQHRDEWTDRREELREYMRWMMGEAPPRVAQTPTTRPRDVAHDAALLYQNAPTGIERAPFSFGEGLTGNVYMPAGLRESGTPAPAVLWLHPFAPAKGYVPAYKRGDPVYITLARAGFAVFCFDQIGHGTRIAEIEHFYQRHPRWSLLGKMFRDSTAALDALLDMPYVNPAQVYALGYGMGSLVGLHLGALDDRLTGLVSVCGPPPFRLDADAALTGGARRWSHLYMQMPLLGLFAPGNYPYDVDHLMACFAPRPLLVVSPTLDREAPLDMMVEAVESAQHVYELYDVATLIDQYIPNAYNHFDDQMQAPVVRWLIQQAGVYVP